MVQRVIGVSYAQCKTIGHAWDMFDPVGRRPTGWGRAIHLRCTRCATERHDVIDGNGELSVRKYEYPSDYKDAKDEKPTRAQMRLLIRQQYRQERKEAS